MRSNGPRDTAAGRVQRYECLPRVGDRHTFSVPIDPAGQLMPLPDPPPVCPEHPASAVIRWGTYGKWTPNPRQRYRCRPDRDEPAHTFTTTLAREHVHVGQDQCDVCDEFRGLHHGETAAANGHTWSTPHVAQALEMLSLGQSYAETSRFLLRASGTEEVRQRTVEREQELDEDERNDPSRLRRNSWHIAADMVEVFGPVVVEPLEVRLRERALRQRAANDELLAVGEPLKVPQVVLIDEVPVYGRTLEKKARRDDGFFLLVAAEQDFTPGRSGLRLRLVRAFAKANTDAWRLVFDELGYDPDFLVADASTAIGAAYRAHYDPARTRFIPSLWHLADKGTTALSASKKATVVVDGRKQLLGPLRTHLRLLGRHSGVLDDFTSWRTWWDELEALAAASGLPTDKLRRRRKVYEPEFGVVLDVVTDHPQVPLTTGGLETVIQRRVMPMLEGRRHAFGNLERTNALFDLVVARDHDWFDSRAEIVRLLRADMTEHDGWAPPLRAVQDARPPGGYYSSLRDPQRLARMARTKGLT